MARQMVVLHIEDSDDDVVFFTRALSQLGSTARVERVRDGGEAQRYLTAAGDFADREKFPMPDAVVLDLRMAGLDGRSFARWLRAQPQFEKLPCYVLADFESFTNPEALVVDGASGIYGKPDDLADWTTRVGDLMRSIVRTLARTTN